MDTATFFSQTLASLNSAQREAVDTVEGPVMVIAGPGTGKTQVLAARIANILKVTDEQPHNILALTFTDAAAKNMRERIVKMIGEAGYYVRITTFHSFCAQVINSHPEYFPIDRDSQPLTDLELYDLFQTIILDATIEHIKPLNSPLHYLRDIMGAISDLKREGVTPDAFEKIIEVEQHEFEQEKDELTKTQQKKQEKNILKHQELLILYREYQKRLRAGLRFDFDDMIALVVEAFSTHELLLREYQEELHYFLIDEYQDTNSAQNQVITLLASWWEEDANVFVVGDPHQSIYRFQGASLENMLSFMSQYPKAKIVTLTEGYRCTQPVYDAANDLISRHQITTASSQTLDTEIVEALATTLNSQKKSIEPIRLFAAPSQSSEAVFVGDAIKKLLESGERPEDIAILYRNRSHAQEFESVLLHFGIPYEIQGGENILQTESIRQLLQFFQVVLDVRSGDEDAGLFEIMCYGWTSVSATLALQLVRTASIEKCTMLELLSLSDEACVAKIRTHTITSAEFAQAREFVEMLKSLSTLDSDHHIVEWFELALKQSGYLDWVLASDEKPRLLTMLTTLFNQVKALAQQNHALKLVDFMSAIAVMKDHNIKLTAEDLNITKGAVKLSTVHSAKGLEWKHVFVVRMVDGAWGNARSRDLISLPEGIITHSDLSKKERNEDDRRLFYVAITRAKENVTLTYPETDTTSGRTKELVGSMFAVEINSHIKQFSEDHITEFLESAQDKVGALLLPAERRVVPGSEREFFKQIVERYTLSVTGLNKYLQDPKAFVLEDLLRVPRAKVEYLSYGSAVHAALEAFYKKYQKNGSPPDVELALNVFQTVLEKELMTSADFNRRVVQGKSVIENYLSERQANEVDVLYIERQFGSGMSTTVLNDIKLSGRIDRVDWIDQSKKTVRVIDYKTGSAKSKNYIDGAIASAGLSEREQALPDPIKGRYKRQLLFYKLLGDLDPSFVPIITEGTFDFIEPSGSAGKPIQRNFALLPEDVALLKELVLEIMAEIRDLEFLETIDFGSRANES